MTHKFARGFFTGLLTAAGAVAGTIYAFKKTYVDPVEDKAEEIDANRRRAVRKSKGAHQG
ncbi:DUF3042 family protein [Lacticaseibacillus thailandensis]|uniref:DUF3042 family protein n=1 Tax=Lacticaseibacillus thailandensis TaxID=381741 RepID=UPI0007053DD2|nr:DUF3042 family protein [Lacticaseibacillus thailandensis]